MTIGLPARLWLISTAMMLAGPTGYAGDSPVSPKPQRSDGPLRVDNISDEEVRQIVGVVRAVLPGSIINISGVTAGCPCENGPGCDSEVWIVAGANGTSHGLMLSRIDGEWTIGPLQQWWLERDAIRDRFREAVIRRDRAAGLDARNALVRHEENYPFCAP